MDHSSEDPHSRMESVESSGECKIDALAQLLGFSETRELLHLRLIITDPTIPKTPDDIDELMARYQIRAEKVVGQERGHDYIRAQIGLIIATATLKRDSNGGDGYVHDLEIAMMYARNMGYGDVEGSIRRALDVTQERQHESSRISQLLERLGPDYGFDRETCVEIAQMSFRDAFETAYGYLIQAGLDPDEILADFVE